MTSISLELALKVLLLPAVGAAVALLLRRRSASVQHLALLAGLLGLIALPVLTAVAPSWEVAEMPLAVEALVPWTGTETAAGSAAPAGVSPGAGNRLALATLFEMLGLAWLAGVVTVALRWLVSHQRSSRLVRGARLESSVRLRRAMDAVARRLALRREVTLLRGSPEQMPFTVGVLRPRVVLPADADEWSWERLEMVLLHELSHVRRVDVAAQHLASLACALYWFHPLVWWMSRRLRAVAERAADDAVLDGGSSAPDYAEELVRIARRYRGCAASTPAVGGEPFEERLEALLADGGRRMSAGAGKCVAALAASLVLVLGVSACAPTEAAPAAPAAEKTSAGGAKWQGDSGRQILIETVIVETKESLVNWSALGDAARGDRLELLSVGDDGQSLEQRLMQGEREGKLRILSSPKILTVDGEQASAQSGLQVPVQTTQGGTVSTQFVNATLRLDMFPVIVDDDIVEVEVTLQKRFPRMELSENGVNAPIATTEANSKFRVRLGGTVVIAGMRDPSQGVDEDLIAFVTVREIEL